MHSLVIDRWPFYIGLSVLVIHLSIYWLNQWKRHHEKKSLCGINIPTILALIHLNKRIQKLENNHESRTPSPPPIMGDNSSEESEPLKIKKRYIVRKN